MGYAAPQNWSPAYNGQSPNNHYNQLNTWTVGKGYQQNTSFAGCAAANSQFLQESESRVSFKQKRNLSNGNSKAQRYGNGLDIGQQTNMFDQN